MSQGLPMCDTGLLTRLHAASAHMPAQPAGAIAGLWLGLLGPAPAQHMSCTASKHLLLAARAGQSCCRNSWDNSSFLRASCGNSRQLSTPSSLDCPGRATVGMGAALQKPTPDRQPIDMLWTHCNITVAVVHLHLRAAVQKQCFATPCRRSPGAGNCHQRQHTHASSFQVHTANQNRQTHTRLEQLHSRLTASRHRLWQLPAAAQPRGVTHD